MSTSEHPEYLEKLSPDQRDKLIAFLDRAADAIIGNEDSERYDEWYDAEIIARGLLVAQTLGYEGERLEALFRREFGIADVNKNQLSGWLAVLSLVDVEERIMIACGGRN
jgi:hypothetical protein